MDPPRLSVFSLCSFLIWFLNLNTLSFSIGLCHCMMCCVLHSLALETWLGWPSNEDMEHWKNDRYTYRKDRLLWVVLALMKGTDYTTQKLSTFIRGQCFLHKLSAFILGPGEEGFVLSPEPHLGKALLSPWVWCTGILDIVSKYTLSQDFICSLCIQSGFLIPTMTHWLNEWISCSVDSSWASASWIHHVTLRWLNMPYCVCTWE